jgi:hypothetical protein
MIGDPLISCLCVTRDKTSLLNRAIRSFHAQTYMNKELVILYESDDLSTRRFLEPISHSHVLKLEVPASPRRTLGELRNLAIHRCHGEFFCQWDDDDWYHHRRIECQMNAIRESQRPACLMVQWLIFDATQDRAYVSNVRPWEGSLLCKTSLIADGMKYDDTARGEETTFVYKLLLTDLIATIVMPQLYIYVYHGKNVWGHDHWENIFSASQALPPESAVIIRDVLNDRLSEGEASRLLDQMMCTK